MNLSVNYHLPLMFKFETYRDFISKFLFHKFILQKQWYLTKCGRALLHRLYNKAKMNFTDNYRPTQIWNLHTVLQFQVCGYILLLTVNPELQLQGGHQTLHQPWREFLLMHLFIYTITIHFVENVYNSCNEWMKVNEFYQWSSSTLAIHTFKSSSSLFHSSQRH